MKLAIVSDIHDHIWNLRRFLDWLDTHPADALLCCGDLCSPFVPALIQKAYTGPIHLVFGNNDEDTFRLTRLTADHVRLHGELAEIEFNGYRVALNHYPDIAEQLARSRRYDLVCYGHNHEIRLRARGQTLLLNPGTLMGYLPEKATFVV